MPFKISLKAERTFRLGDGYHSAHERRAEILSLGRNGEAVSIPFPNDLCIDTEDVKPDKPFCALWEKLQRRVYDRRSISHEDVLTALESVKKASQHGGLVLKIADVAKLTDMIALSSDPSSTPQRATRIARELAISTGEIDANYKPYDPFKDGLS